MQVKADFYFYGFFFLRDFHANKNCMRCWEEMPVIRTKCWKKNTHTIIGNVLGSVLNCRKIPCPESFQFLCMSCVAFRKRKWNLFSLAVPLNLIINLFSLNVATSYRTDCDVKFSTLTSLQDQRGMNVVKFETSYCKIS